MINSKKQMFLVISVFAVLLMLTTVTYAFFNYTRTGSANTIKVGRISFNTEQTTVNLDNIFPISSSEVATNTENISTATIHVIGDTTYSGGIEYLVTVSDLHNTYGNNNSKILPISVDVSYVASENKTIGMPDDSYYTNRGGNSSIYKILSDRIYKEDNSKLLVGYIAPNETGIDGTITIKAFVDKDRIAISDTYPSSSLEFWYNTDAREEDINACITYMTDNYSSSLESDETMDAFCRGTGELDYSTMESWANYYFSEEDKRFMEEHHLISKYQNGTTSEWARGRTVLTTEEWNSFNDNGISFKVKVEANEGIWAGKPGNAMATLENIFSSTVGQNVKEVYFDDINTEEMHQRYEAATYKKDITYDNEGEVLAWLETNSTDNTKYTMYIASDGETMLTSANYLLTQASIRPEIVEFNNVNTSRVTSMSNMFYDQENLKEIDISSFDTSNVTDMYALFYHAKNLDTINMSGLDMRNVQRMNAMFKGDTKLKNLNWDNIRTRDVTIMTEMFQGCSSIESINFSGLGGDNLDGFISVFYDCNNLVELDFSNFNFGISSLNAAFYNLPKLERINLSGANTSRVSNMSQMFYNDAVLTYVDLSYLGGDNIGNLWGMFHNSPNLKEVNMTGFNFGMAGAGNSPFYGNTILEKVNLTGAKFNNLTSMFSGCSSLKDLNLTNIITSNVNNTYQTFYNCTSLETIDLSDADFSNVTTSVNMFSGATNLKTIFVSNSSNLNNITNSYGMFYGCSSIVGGQGTTYDSDHTDGAYAIIDDRNNGNPGYLTYKAHS